MLLQHFFSLCVCWFCCFCNKNKLKLPSVFQIRCAGCCAIAILKFIPIHTNDAAKTLTASGSHHQLNETGRSGEQSQATSLSTSSFLKYIHMILVRTECYALSLSLLLCCYHSFGLRCVRVMHTQETCVTRMLFSHSITN